MTAEGSINVVSSRLADGLLPYVSEDQLKQNYQTRYDELVATMPPQLLARREAAKEVLLQVPLVHGTRMLQNAQHILHQGVTPSAQRAPHEYSNTFHLDKSLGLDGYGFSSVGQLHVNRYGEYRVLIDPRHLYDDNVIVTPRDIYRHGINHRRSFDDQEPRIRERVMQRYFGRMMLGRDWLDITALQMLQTANATRGEAVWLNSFTDAEVKSHGGIPSHRVMRYVASSSARILQHELVGKGVILSHHDATARREGEWREDGLMLTAGRQVWRSILGIDPAAPVVEHRSMP